MPRFKQKPFKVETIQLQYRTLIQTPEGAMSAEPGDYLETIRVEGKVHQRIVPQWVFNAGRMGYIKHNSKQPEQAIEADKVYTEPHDGYPLLTRECIHG